MSTYKSLGGPPSGLIVTSDPALAERLEAIAFPGLTANFDAGKTAALAITLADWLAFGTEHATAMVEGAQAFAAALAERGLPVVRTPEGFTRSHALALDLGAGPVGALDRPGGTAAARHLRRANLLASAIGLPAGPDDGLRLGLNELIRWGAGPHELDAIADLVARALVTDRPEELAPATTELRSTLTTIRFAL